MINLLKITEFLQEKLGNDFEVGVDYLPDNGLIPCILSANRTPFAADKDTESLTIRLGIYATVTVTTDKISIHDHIRTLMQTVNSNQFTIDEHKTLWYIQSFEPVMTEIRNGQYASMFEISGTILSSKSGVIFAQNINIELEGETLKLITFSCSYTKDHKLENKIATEEMTILTEGIQRIYAVSFLAEDITIFGDLEDEILGVTTGLETEYSLTYTRGTNTLTRDVKLVTGEIQATIGSYLIVTCTFKV